MDNVWTALVPLIVGSALVPVQLLITILLINTSRLTALAWVAGTSTVRLAQGVLFGLVLSTDELSETGGGPGPIAASLLLVAGLLFLLTAFRSLLGDEDPDAPPPRWMSAVEGMSPARAYLFGAGATAVGVKFWVFTLTAIAVIGDADLGQPSATVTFLAFVVLASSVQVALIALAFAAPQRSEATLTRVSDWLSAHNRALTVVIGAVFGIWFVAKALDGFGVI